MNKTILHTLEIVMHHRPQQELLDSSTKTIWGRATQCCICFIFIKHMFPEPSCFISYKKIIALFTILKVTYYTQMTPTLFVTRESSSRWTVLQEGQTSHSTTYLLT